ncbi:MAG: carbon-nitrogen hydrolase family protein [Kofleriaceae bacterium]
MPQPWSLPTAAIQLCATDDLSANLATTRREVEAAAAAGARLVVLPECFAFLGRREGDKLAIAEDVDATPRGPIMATLGDLALRHRLWIVGGGIAERIPGDERRAYNTAVVVGPDGGLRARYRKIHLFDVDIPGGAQLRESDGTRAGDELVVVDVDGVKVGLTICYDVRFPELYRRLTLELGAEVVVVPAAFTAHTGRAHWHTLLRARAIEDQAWIVAAAQWGWHNDKRESFGHSLVVDPWGEIVGELAEGDGAVVATLSGEAVARTRTQMPCGQHASLWRRERE